MIASFLCDLDNARTATDPHLLTATEVAAHELNHRVRRSLGGKTPCEVHHNPALRLLLDRRSRGGILRLLVGEYCTTLQSMAGIDQRRAAAAWRRIVEYLAPLPGTDHRRQQPTTRQKCVTHFSKKMVSQLGFHYT